MPQSARATFKLTKPASALARLAFQCLNRHEQPSSTPPGHRPGPYLNGFNASIGTSNLQASRINSYPYIDVPVSMPQSARATFKPFVPGRLRIGENSVSMPQSARATFKRKKVRFPHKSRSSFNASIGTSNLQALFESSKTSRWYRFNASIGTSNLQAHPVLTGWLSSVMFQCLNRHEQPSSAIKEPIGIIIFTRFNASIGTSNLQAALAQYPRSEMAGFQCLNRHEQPSSPVPEAG